MSSSMTRQHFDAIAEAICRIDGENLRSIVVERLIPVLGSFNEAFNATRFRDMCNVATLEPDPRPFRRIGDFIVRDMASPAQISMPVPSPGERIEIRGNDPPPNHFTNEMPAWVFNRPSPVSDSRSFESSQTMRWLEQIQQRMEEPSHQESAAIRGVAGDWETPSEDVAREVLDDLTRNANENVRATNAERW